MDVHVSFARAEGGKYEPCGVLVFPPLSKDWLAEGRMPTKDEILPRKLVSFPDGDSLELAVVYDAGSSVVTVHAFERGKQFMLLVVDKLRSVMVMTPSGRPISIGCFD